MNDAQILYQSEAVTVTSLLSPAARVDIVSASIVLATLDEARKGIEERCYGPSGPLLPPTTEGSVPRLRSRMLGNQHYTTFNGEMIERVYSACRFEWTISSIIRFLDKCTWHIGPHGWCLRFNGARSRGKGNQAWYGSFWTKGKTVRAHKFFAVAVLGLRPRPDREDELDHHCFDTRCVSCMQVLTYEENQKRQRRRMNNDTSA